MYRRGSIGALEIVILTAVFGIVIALVGLIQKGYLVVQRAETWDRLQELKKILADYYYRHAFVINSLAFDSGIVTTQTSSGPVQGGCLPLIRNGDLVNGICSDLRYVPRSKENRSSISLIRSFFGIEPYDEGSSNFRIYVSPLKRDYRDRFSYRDIWIIYTKGGRFPVKSRVVCEQDSTSGGTPFVNCNVVCDPSEVCIKVDGKKITEDLYQKTWEELQVIAEKIQNYAQQLFAEDPQRDNRVYYFAHNNSLGHNDSSPNCDDGKGGCFFSHLSEIRLTFDGYTNFSFRLPYLRNLIVPFYSSNSEQYLSLSEMFMGANFLSSYERNPLGAPIYYCNYSKRSASSMTVLRTPELNSRGGYNLLLLTFLDDRHILKYVVPQ